MFVQFIRRSIHKNNNKEYRDKERVCLVFSTISRNTFIGNVKRFYNQTSFKAKILKVLCTLKLFQEKTLP